MLLVNRCVAITTVPGQNGLSVPHKQIVKIKKLTHIQVKANAHQQSNRGHVQLFIQL
jgi:hypothetical protein